MAHLVLGEDGVCSEDVSRQWGKRVESVRQEGEWKGVPSISLLLSPISLAMALLVLGTFIIPIKMTNNAKMR